MIFTHTLFKKAVNNHFLLEKGYANLPYFYLAKT